MKLGFTGTQNGMNTFQIREFIKLLHKYDPDEFHHGDCIGSDKQAHFRFINYHLENNTKERTIVIHPPTNKGKSAFTYVIDKWPREMCTKLLDAKYKLDLKMREPFAYLARNQDIVRECDVLIACPKEVEHTLRSGTWATIRYGWHQKKETIVIPPLRNED